MSNSTPKNRKLTTEEFIRRAKEKHGDRYIYVKSSYKGLKEKVTIICEHHGEFDNWRCWIYI